MNITEYLLQHYTNGIFVDIGANDGIIENWTYQLELNNWNGICVEALDVKYNELCRNRKCICINEVVDYCDDRYVDFVEQRYDNRGVGGLFGSMIMEYDKNDDKYEFFQNLVNNASSVIINKYQGKITKRKTKSLNTILQECKCPTNINFLKIDTEGFEYQILKTFDYNKYNIDFILSEGNILTSKIPSLLKHNNYSLIHNTTMDMLFKNNNYITNETMII